MKKKRQHIKQILTLTLLWVFSLAITPWSALHHHPEVATNTLAEKHCTHKLHLKTEQDTCLICKAHFEKNYTVAAISHPVFLSSELLQGDHPILTSSYAELIATSLRGPPALS